MSRAAQAAAEAMRRNPGLYAAHVLRVRWWEKQAQIAEALVRHKRVFVKAAHAVGKTHLAAGLVNWHFDLYDPGIALTTGPTQSQVADVLWQEVRTQRRGRPGLLPRATRMETGPAHFAVGYTSRDDAAFQGRHAERVLIVFDECTGIDAPIWEAAEGMAVGPGCLWLAICNPTDTSSHAYEEEQSGRFHALTVSALEHPNIAAELAGLPAPYPGAVSLRWVRDRLRDWCDEVTPGDAMAGDVEFPPGSGRFYRPGPLFEGRVLGRWPHQGSRAVWSEAAWQACLREKPLEPGDGPTCIGCDVARFGEDSTVMVVRRGPAVLHHESHNGWDTARTAQRIKELAARFAQPDENPRRVAVFVDDDGVGGGVVDQRGRHTFAGCSAAARARAPREYPNRRSELWFSLAARAASGELDLTRLPRRTSVELRRQAMAPRWHVDDRGRRSMEGKEELRRRLGRSPDDMDALNLAYAGETAADVEKSGDTWV